MMACTSLSFFLPKVARTISRSRDVSSDYRKLCVSAPFIASLSFFAVALFHFDTRRSETYFSTHSRRFRFHQEARWRQEWLLKLLSMSTGASAPSYKLSATPIPFKEWVKHVDVVLDATADLRGLPSGRYAGHSGPWIEEIFSNVTRRPLHSWYPFVPLFAEWTNVCCSKSLEMISRSNEAYHLFQNNILRDDVIYIAVTQHDMGAPGPWLLNFSLYRNTFIFSGGG